MTISRGAKPKLTGDNLEKCINLHKNGETYANIAKQLEVCVATVGKAIRQSENKTKRGARQKLTPEQIEICMEMYETDFTYKEMAKHFNVSLSTIGIIIRTNKDKT